MRLLRKPNYASPRAGAVEIGLLILSIGLSYLAGVLLRKQSDSPVDRDKPTTLSKRGSYMTWLCGVRRVGPVFAWAGNRGTKKESAGGGKGGGGAEVEVFYEAGWHILASGPCDALHNITQQGKRIFEGPITRTSHPSGSTIDLGKEGSFTIYWGEVDQPVNTFLGDSGRVGISSRWPYACYVVWNKKRLGSSPNWPILDYDVERRPSTSILAGFDSWYEPTETLDGRTANITGFVANANPDIGYLEVAGDYTKDFDPGRSAYLSGNALADGAYIVRKTALVQVIIGTSWTGKNIYTARTRVYLEAGTVGANAAGTLQAYTAATDDGANIASAMAELLFAPYPQGLGLDPDGPEPFDIPSLEALGVEAEAEGWRASLVGVDGEEAKAILGNALQDHGTMLPLNSATGLLYFNRVRPPVGTLANLPEQINVEDLPEVETYHGEPQADQMVFEFADRDHEFSTMTISVDDDGTPLYLDPAKAHKVPLPSVTHFATAGSLSEARSQEELVAGSEFRIPAARGARDFIPGQAITADGFDEVLRVLGVDIEPLSAQVNLKVMPDYYGARRSDFVNQPGGGQPQFEQPELDLQFKFLEVPEQLLSTEEMFGLVARIRAHSQIISSAVHFSRDNSTYNLVGSYAGAATGGTLDSTMAGPEGVNYLAQGPTITLLGPDASILQDLSADPTNFGLGRQLCVFYSSEGVEVCYLEKATALGGDTYRLDGLLRARYDTRKLAHPAGAEVYIFGDTTLDELQDLLLEPGQDLYVKSQPSTTAGSVSLAAVPPHGDVLRGKGLVPIDPEGLRVSAPHKGSSGYHSGDAVTLKWSWSSAASSNTGAGFQNAGAVIGAPVMKGSFVVELRTNAGALVQTDITTSPTITYSNATLVASPISETTFKVRVYHTYNGYTSDYAEITVTKLT